jgi:hypothetical protein
MFTSFAAVGAVSGRSFVEGAGRRPSGPALTLFGTNGHDLALLEVIGQTIFVAHHGPPEAGIGRPVPSLRHFRSVRTVLFTAAAVASSDFHFFNVRTDSAAAATSSDFSGTL